MEMPVVHANAPAAQGDAQLPAELAALSLDERAFVARTLQQLPADEVAQLRARCVEQPPERRAAWLLQAMQHKKIQTLFAPAPAQFTPTQASLLLNIAHADDEALEQKRRCPGPCRGEWFITADRALCSHCMRTTVGRVSRHAKKLWKDARRDERNARRLQHAAALREQARLTVAASHAPNGVIATATAVNQFLSLTP